MLNGKMMYEGSVVGTTFEPAKSNIPIAIDYLNTFVDWNSFIEPIVELKHNPLNKYDSNALEVHIGYEGKTFFVGHIPKTHNKQLLDMGLENLNTELDRFYFDDNSNPFGLAVKISLLINEGDY